jgi:hypothetical protein
MNQPIIYAIVAMACYGLSDFIYKRAAAAASRRPSKANTVRGKPNTVFGVRT